MFVLRSYQHHENKTKLNHGFTIVELLIVIVVIAILAAVSVIAYNGVAQRSNQQLASNELQTWNMPGFKPDQATVFYNVEHIYVDEQY